MSEGGIVFFRESCFRQSGDKQRRSNPTHYRRALRGALCSHAPGAVLRMRCSSFPERWHGSETGRDRSKACLFCCACKKFSKEGRQD